MSPLRLAWSNLMQQRSRTLISLVGVAFAVLLVFMQLGFLDALVRTATLLYDKLDFDLLLVSTEYGNVARPMSFSRDRLGQARGVGGVESVRPLTALLGEWRDPRPTPGDPEAPRPNHSILVVAADPASLGGLFRRPVGTVFASAEEFAEDAVHLGRLDTVLFDRTSRAEYGDPKRWKKDPYNELNGRGVEVAGLIAIGTGFAYNGLVMTSEATLTRVTGWPADRVSFGLVKLRPGADAEAVRRELLARMAGSGDSEEREVDIYTRAGISGREQHYWLTGTAVGQFFIAGVLIAMVVGGVFVYQMMAADIARRLAEYATIRALGYPGGYLSRVVFWQGLFLALVGYVPGLLVSLAGYEVVKAESGAPIGMTLARVAGVFALTVLMCMGSALAAVREAHQANPADLF